MVHFFVLVSRSWLIGIRYLMKVSNLVIKGLFFSLDDASAILPLKYG